MSAEYLDPTMFETAELLAHVRIRLSLLTAHARFANAGPGPNSFSLLRWRVLAGVKAAVRAYE
jgi:hypothetical protein